MVNRHWSSLSSMGSVTIEFEHRKIKMAVGHEWARLVLLQGGLFGGL